ncbi:hypothetical protein [Bradyrhizobium sp. WSM4349]|uniref:hypothetical protein n=1 Tax=Bradyrhizobium sp. WSM4349 TaxID=1040988 RepID=UPI0012F71335|nr:hypothetical protein [Bradyrhizobium sp. WSM4349]
MRATTSLRPSACGRCWRATRRSYRIGRSINTIKGKAMGRGLQHFREEGAKLVPPRTADDPYEDEAYRLWAIKQQGQVRR